LTILINHEYSLVFLLADVTHYFNIYHVLQSGQQRTLSRQLAACGVLINISAVLCYILWFTTSIIHLLSWWGTVLFF